MSDTSDEDTSDRDFWSNSSDSSSELDSTTDSSTHNSSDNTSESDSDDETEHSDQHRSDPNRSHFTSQVQPSGQVLWCVWDSAEGDAFSAPHHRSVQQKKPVHSGIQLRVSQSMAHFQKDIQAALASEVKHELDNPAQSDVVKRIKTDFTVDEQIAFFFDYEFEEERRHIMTWFELAVTHKIFEKSPSDWDMEYSKDFDMICRTFLVVNGFDEKGMITSIQKWWRNNQATQGLEDFDWINLERKIIHWIEEHPGEVTLNTTIENEAMAVDPAPPEGIVGDVAPAPVIQPAQGEDVDVDKPPAEQPIELTSYEIEKYQDKVVVIEGDQLSLDDERRQTLGQTLGRLGDYYWFPRAAFEVDPKTDQIKMEALPALSKDSVKDDKNENVPKSLVTLIRPKLIEGYGTADSLRVGGKPVKSDPQLAKYMEESEAQEDKDWFTTMWSTGAIRRKAKNPDGNYKVTGNLPENELLIKLNKYVRWREINGSLAARAAPKAKPTTKTKRNSKARVHTCFDHIKQLTGDDALNFDYDAVMCRYEVFNWLEKPENYSRFANEFLAYFGSEFSEKYTEASGLKDITIKQMMNPEWDLKNPLHIKSEDWGDSVCIWLLATVYDVCLCSWKPDQQLEMCVGIDEKYVFSAVFGDNLHNNKPVLHIFNGSGIHFDSGQTGSIPIAPDGNCLFGAFANQVRIWNDTHSDYSDYQIKFPADSQNPVSMQLQEAAYTQTFKPTEETEPMTITRWMTIYADLMTVYVDLMREKEKISGKQKSQKGPWESDISKGVAGALIENHVDASAFDDLVDEIKEMINHAPDVIVRLMDQTLISYQLKEGLSVTDFQELKEYPEGLDVEYVRDKGKETEHTVTVFKKFPKALNLTSQKDRFRAQRYIRHNLKDFVRKYLKEDLKSEWDGAFAEAQRKLNMERISSMEEITDADLGLKAKKPKAKKTNIEQQDVDLSQNYVFIDQTFHLEPTSEIIASIIQRWGKHDNEMLSGRYDTGYENDFDMPDDTYESVVDNFTNDLATYGWTNDIEWDDYGGCNLWDIRKHWRAMVHLFICQVYREEVYMAFQTTGLDNIKPFFEFDFEKEQAVLYQTEIVKHDPARKNIIDRLTRAFVHLLEKVIRFQVCEEGEIEIHGNRLTDFDANLVVEEAAYRMPSRQELNKYIQKTLSELHDHFWRVFCENSSDRFDIPADLPDMYEDASWREKEDWYIDNPNYMGSAPIMWLSGTTEKRQQKWKASCKEWMTLFENLPKRRNIDVYDVTDVQQDDTIMMEGTGQQDEISDGHKTESSSDSESGSEADAESGSEADAHERYFQKQLRFLGLEAKTKKKEKAPTAPETPEENRLKHRWTSIEDQLYRESLHLFEELKDVKIDQSHEEKVRHLLDNMKHFKEKVVYGSISATHWTYKHYSPLKIMVEDMEAYYKCMCLGEVPRWKEKEYQKCYNATRNRLLRIKKTDNDGSELILPRSENLLSVLADDLYYLADLLGRAPRSQEEGRLRNFVWDQKLKKEMGQRYKKDEFGWQHLNACADYGAMKKYRIGTPEDAEANLSTILDWYNQHSKQSEKIDISSWKPLIRQKVSVINPTKAEHMPEQYQLHIQASDRNLGLMQLVKMLCAWHTFKKYTADTDTVMVRSRCMTIANGESYKEGDLIDCARLKPEHPVMDGNELQEDDQSFLACTYTFCKTCIQQSELTWILQWKRPGAKKRPGEKEAEYVHLKAPETLEEKKKFICPECAIQDGGAECVIAYETALVETLQQKKLKEGIQSNTVKRDEAAAANDSDNVQKLNQKIARANTLLTESQKLYTIDPDSVQLDMTIEETMDNGRDELENTLLLYRHIDAYLKRYREDYDENETYWSFQDVTGAADKLRKVKEANGGEIPPLRKWKEFNDGLYQLTYDQIIKIVGKTEREDLVRECLTTFEQDLESKFFVTSWAEYVKCTKSVQSNIDRRCKVLKDGTIRDVLQQVEKIEGDFKGLLRRLLQQDYNLAYQFIQQMPYKAKFSANTTTPEQVHFWRLLCGYTAYDLHTFSSLVHIDHEQYGDSDSSYDFWVKCKELSPVLTWFKLWSSLIILRERDYYLEKTKQQKNSEEEAQDPKPKTPFFEVFKQRVNGDNQPVVLDFPYQAYSAKLRNRNLWHGNSYDRFEHLITDPRKAEPELQKAKNELQVEHEARLIDNAQSVLDLMQQVFKDQYEVFYGKFETAMERLYTLQELDKEDPRYKITLQQIELDKQEHGRVYGHLIQLQQTLTLPITKISETGLMLLWGPFCDDFKFDEATKKSFYQLLETYRSEGNPSDRSSVANEAIGDARFIKSTFEKETRSQYDDTLPDRKGAINETMDYDEEW